MWMPWDLAMANAREILSAVILFPACLQYLGADSAMVPTLGADADQWAHSDINGRQG